MGKGGAKATLRLNGKELKNGKIPDPAPGLLAASRAAHAAGVKFLQANARKVVKRYEIKGGKSGLLDVQNTKTGVKISPAKVKGKVLKAFRKNEFQSGTRPPVGEPTGTGAFSATVNEEISASMNQKSELRKVMDKAFFEAMKQ